MVTAISQSPLAYSGRTLFTGDNSQLPITQGNSFGQVNSPKVRSEASIQCGVCEKNFKTNEETKEHMKIHDDASSADKSVSLEDDEEEEQEISSIAEDLEFARVAKEVENLVMVDMIVDKFVENAYQAMNPSEKRGANECHECTCKDQVITNYRASLDEKDSVITEKTAAIKGYQEMLNKMTINNTEANKRLKQGEKMKDIMVEKTKEVEILRAEVKTKDAIIAMLKTDAEEVRQDQSIIVEEEVLIQEQVAIKKCKKCQFTATSMRVLQLHIENDHQGNQFCCERCDKKFSLKNQLKLHKRQDHEVGSFSCFVCNSRFRTHKDLKQHMQKSASPKTRQC